MTFFTLNFCLTVLFFLEMLLPVTTDLLAKCQDADEYEIMDKISIHVVIGHKWFDHSQKFLS